MTISPEIYFYSTSHFVAKYKIELSFPHWHYPVSLPPPLRFHTVAEIILRLFPYPFIPSAYSVASSPNACTANTIAKHFQFTNIAKANKLLIHINVNIIIL